MPGIRQVRESTASCGSNMGRYLPYHVHSKLLYPIDPKSIHRFSLNYGLGKHPFVFAKYRRTVVPIIMTTTKTAYDKRKEKMLEEQYKLFQKAIQCNYVDRNCVVTASLQQPIAFLLFARI